MARRTGETPLIDLLKIIGAPGSIPFLAVSVLIGAGLARYSVRWRRIGGAWLGLVCALYVLLALPVIAHGIADALPALPDQAPTSPVAMLIVLDGDNRRGRVREVERALRDGPPAVIYILGGRWMREALADAGVADSRIRFDETATTTREQIAQVRDIAAGSGSGGTAVVVSRLQAPRVAALTGAHGLNVTLRPSAIDVEPPAAGAGRFVPAYTALRVSRDAIYEHAALAYYRWRGWIE